MDVSCVAEILRGVPYRASRCEDCHEAIAMCSLSQTIDQESNAHRGQAVVGLREAEGLRDMLVDRRNPSADHKAYAPCGNDLPDNVNQKPMLKPPRRGRAP